MGMIIHGKLISENRRLCKSLLTYIFTHHAAHSD